MSVRAKRIIEVVKIDGTWYYWQCKAGNGKVLFRSPSFNTKYHCKKQAEREYAICKRAKIRTEYLERGKR